MKHKLTLGAKAAKVFALPISLKSGVVELKSYLKVNTHMELSDAELAVAKSRGLDAMIEGGYVTLESDAPVAKNKINAIRIPLVEVPVVEESPAVIKPIVEEVQEVPVEPVVEESPEESVESSEESNESDESNDKPKSRRKRN